MDRTEIVEAGKDGALAAELLAFVRRRRAALAAAAARAAALRVVLPLLVPAIVLAWAWPASLPTAAGAVALLTAGASLSGALAARRDADAQLFGSAAQRAATEAATGARLAELGDELRTWLQPGPAGQAPMRAWLARDVHGKLPQVPAATLAALGRARVGRVLWLLPLALLLLLAWFLADLLSPPWAGVLGGRTTASAGGGGGQGEGERGDGGGAGEQQPQDARTEGSQPPKDTLPPPPPPAPSPPTQQPEGPPPPLLDLGTQQRFLVPEFVGDGPTRRARMHAAEVDAGGATAAGAQRGAGAPPRPEPERQRDQFERAAEQALQARHVPPAERPMVRRFFASLREAAR